MDKMDKKFNINFIRWSEPFGFISGPLVDTVLSVSVDGFAESERKVRAAAKEWLRCGQVAEAAQRIDDAVSAFEQAIACLNLSELISEAYTYDLAVAWMNHGNALQKKDGLVAFEQSAASYRRTIDLLDPLAKSANGILLTLGCAWMNKGGALQKLNRSAQATVCFDNAARILSTLPIETDAHSRHMLAAAWMNQGSAALKVAAAETSGYDMAELASRKALVLVAQEEISDPVAFDLALRARCILCEIMAAKMRNDSAGAVSISAEASDIAEEALGLARLRGKRVDISNHQTMVVWFFRYGAACYADQQPQFLAAFIEESMHWVATTGMASVQEEFKRIAISTIASARTRMHSFLFAEPSSPEAEHWLFALRSLEGIDQVFDVL